MARPQKKGMEYFPFDVGFFDDIKIKELRGKYGSDGIMVYIYLLCLIYKENGYYIKINDGFDYVASVDLNMDNEKIGQIINFLCKRSLFDDKLFTSDKVLTSHGIQVRFQEAVKTRATKKEIEVNEFWILNENETQGYIKCADFRGLSEKNGSYSEKNHSFSIEKPPKVKERKVKKSKADINVSAVIAEYEDNIAPITTHVKNGIIDWCENVKPEVVIYAIHEAVDNNKRNWKYIEAIIRSHYNAGRKTLKAVEQASADYKRSKGESERSYYNSGVDHEELERIMHENYDCREELGND